MADTVSFAVGLGRVDVQIAAQVGAIDELRQPPRSGRFDFAASFAQLRRNPCETERRVDAFLGLRPPRASSPRA